MAGRADQEGFWQDISLQGFRDQMFRVKQRSAVQFIHLLNSEITLRSVLCMKGSSTPLKHALQSLMYKFNHFIC